MPKTETPKYLSDGFRDERCVYCGEKIGYAFFLAHQYTLADGTVFDLDHRERDGSRPSWCQRTQEGR